MYLYTIHIIIFTRFNIMRNSFTGSNNENAAARLYKTFAVLLYVGRIASFDEVAARHLDTLRERAARMQMCVHTARRILWRSRRRRCGGGTVVCSDRAFRRLGGATAAAVYLYSAFPPPSPAGRCHRFPVLFICDIDGFISYGKIPRG